MDKEQWVKNQMNILYKELQKYPIDENTKERGFSQAKLGRLARKAYNICVVFEELENYDSDISFKWMYPISIIVLTIGFLTLLTSIVHSTRNPYHLYFGLLSIILIVNIIASVMKYYHTESKRTTSDTFSILKKVKRTLDDIKNVVKRNKGLNEKDLGKKISLSFKLPFFKSFEETYKEKIHNNPEFSIDTWEQRLHRYHEAMGRIETLFAPTKIPPNPWERVLPLLIQKNPDGFQRRLSEMTPLTSSELRSVVSEYNTEHSDIVKQTRIALTLGGTPEELIRLINMNDGTVVHKQYIHDILIPEARKDVQTVSPGFQSYYATFEYKDLDKQYKIIDDALNAFNDLDTKPYDPLSVQRFLVKPVSNNTLGIGLLLAIIFSIGGIFVLEYALVGQTYVYKLKQLFFQPFRDDRRAFFTQGYLIRRITLLIAILVLPPLFYGRALIGHRYQDDMIEQNTELISTSLKNVKDEINRINEDEDEEKLIKRLKNVYENGTIAIHAYNSEHKYTKRPDTGQPFPFLIFIFYVCLFILSIAGISWLIKNHMPTANVSVERPPVPSYYVSLVLLFAIISFIVIDMVRVHRYIVTESYEYKAY